HPELVHHQEIVPLRMLPVDELNRPVAPVIPPRNAIHRGAKQQPLCQFLIDLNQPTRLWPQQRPHRLRSPPLIQPLLAVTIKVDPPNSVPKPSLQEHLPERPPPRHPWIGFRPLSMRPA